MNRLSRTMLFAALCALAVPLAGTGVSHAADANAPRTQSQMEVTIINVDKYGVYVPNYIFYWDDGMSKQKMESLKKLAEKMRNKKVVLLYSATDDLSKDKRPLLVDMATTKEELKVASAGEPAPVERPVPPPPDPMAGDDPASSHLWKEAMKRDDSTRPAKDPLTGGPTSPRTQTPEEAKPLPPAPQSVTREEVSGLVRRILSLNERKDLSTMLSYYADQVNYYDRGTVDKEYIRKDMGYYFRNWDTIHSSVDGDVVMIVTGEPDSRIVKFVSSFTVQNAKRTASGKTENVWKVKRIDKNLKIVDVKQKVLRSENP